LLLEAGDSLINGVGLKGKCIEENDPANLSPDIYYSLYEYQTIVKSSKNPIKQT
jgi:hypothetical protein